MRETSIPAERRVELTNAEVTLDGERAVVVGYKRRFATVRSLVTAASADFAWETVERIVVDKDGAFRS